MLGAAIGYFATKATDPARANHIMKWGLIWTVPAAVLWTILPLLVIGALLSGESGTADLYAAETTSPTGSATAASPPDGDASLRFDSGRVSARDLHVSTSDGYFSDFDRVAELIRKIDGYDADERVAYDPAGNAWDMRCDNGASVYPASVNMLAVAPSGHPYFADNSNFTWILYFGEMNSAREYFEEIGTTMSSVEAGDVCVDENDWGHYTRFHDDDYGAAVEDTEIEFQKDYSLERVPEDETTYTYHLSARLLSNVVVITNASSSAKHILNDVTDALRSGQGR